MYKLTIVSGPNRGTSFAVRDGELSIGRQNGNAVVLPSTRVSKRHCVLVCSHGEILVRDAGSANGTFVNGVMSRERKVSVGDRISVGEYILELSNPPARGMESAPAVAGIGNVLQFPHQGGVNQSSSMPATMGTYPMSPGNEMAGVPGGVNLSEQIPTDLKGRLLWRFDHKVMPFFYNLLMKNEWRMVCVGIFGAFIFLNLILSVQPLISSSTRAIVGETKMRARLMARQLVQHNTPLIAQGAETKTSLNSIDREEGVRMALITDLDSRIIAPGSRMNQYLTIGDEAKLTIAAKSAYAKGESRGFAVSTDDGTVVAIEPIKVFDSKSAQNVVVAMAIVSVDSNLSTLQMGEMSMIYAETLITTGVLAFLVMLILYRLTLRPMQVLNEDIDRVLKGDMPEVTREFRIEELNPLWDIINSSLQRVPKGADGGLGGLDAMGMGGPSIDDFLGPMKMFGSMAKFGIIVCDSDQRILYMNDLFEDLSGIRLDNSMGQELSVVGRDQAFNAMVSDLFGRSVTGSEGLVEEFDFSGVSYRMTATALGAVGGSAKGYVLAAVKGEG